MVNTGKMEDNKPQKKRWKFSKKVLFITLAIFIIVAVSTTVLVLIMHHKSPDKTQSPSIDKNTPLSTGLANPVASNVTPVEGDEGVVRWLEPKSVSPGEITSYLIRIDSELCPDLNATFSVKAIDTTVYEENTPTDDKPYLSFFKLYDTYTLRTTAASCIKNSTGTKTTQQQIATAYITARSDTKQSEETPVSITGIVFE